MCSECSVWCAGVLSLLAMLSRNGLVLSVRQCLFRVRGVGHSVTSSSRNGRVPSVSRHLGVRCARSYLSSTDTYGMILYLLPGVVLCYVVLAFACSVCWCVSELVC